MEAWRDVEIKELFKSTALLSIQRLTTLALGIIRVKVSAIFLLPAGVGIVAQLNSMRLLLEQFVSLGVGSGITKYAAEYSSERDRESFRLLIRTATSGFLIIGVSAFVVCLLFSRRLASLIVADPSLGLLIVIIGAAVPIIVQVEVISRCLQGMLKIREMVLLSIISAFLGLIVTIPLIILAGVTGAIVSILLSAAIAFIIGQFYLRNVVLKEYDIRLRLSPPDRGMSIKLLRFGGTRGVVAVLEAITILTIRSLIIGRLGADANGLYEVAIALSNQYLGIILAAVWTYGMPKVATMPGDSEGISRLQNDALRLIFLTLVPLIVLILVFREIWIPILFSGAFLGAYTLISWELLGDIFRATGWAANLTILPRERFGFLIGINLGRFTIQLVSFWLLLPRLGLVAAPLSYALANGIMLPAILLGHYIYDRFTYSAQNWILIAKSVPVLLLALFMTLSPDPKPLLNYLLPLAALGIWAMVTVSREEYRNVIGSIAGLLTREEK